jgi:hypothetical protein
MSMGLEAIVLKRSHESTPAYYNAFTNRMLPIPDSSKLTDSPVLQCNAVWALLADRRAHVCNSKFLQSLA